MSRTSFRDTDLNAVSSAAERAAVSVAFDRIDQLEQNINRFIAVVDEVVFNVNEADAEGWMSNWQANLLSGNLVPTAPEPFTDIADEDAAADPVLVDTGTGTDLEV